MSTQFLVNLILRIYCYFPNTSLPKTNSGLFIQHLEDGVEDAGLPAVKERGEGVPSCPLGEGVGEELTHLLYEGGGSHLEVVGEVALGRQGWVFVGKDYDKGRHLGQVAVGTWCG